MLCGEPWCFHTDQVARLTDWQVEWMYLRPAAERARKDSGAAPGPGHVPDPFADGLPPRWEFVNAMLQSDGGSPAHWDALYSRLEAERKGK